MERKSQYFVRAYLWAFELKTMKRAPDHLYKIWLRSWNSERVLPIGTGAFHFERKRFRLWFARNSFSLIRFAIPIRPILL
jgi:hypothetical protein